MYELWPKEMISRFFLRLLVVDTYLEVHGVLFVWSGFLLDFMLFNEYLIYH